MNGQVIYMQDGPLSWPPYRTPVDDAMTRGYGPYFLPGPAQRVPVPVQSTQYVSAGPNPTMGFLGGAVGGLVDWISGADKKAERAARATADAQIKAAEAQVRAAMIAASAGTAIEQEKTARLKTTLLLGGGVALGAIVLISALKK